MSFEHAKQVWQEQARIAEERLTALFSEENAAERCQEEADFLKLAHWAVGTKVSAYTFVEKGWESFPENIHSAVSFFSTLHHALVDDGDVSFVSLVHKGEVLRVYLTFDWRFEEGFRERQLANNKDLIAACILANSTQRRVRAAMQEKYPERDLVLPALVSEEDFEFTAHQDVATFIAEVEAHDAKVKARAAAFDERMEQLRTQTAPTAISSCPESA